ICYIYSKDLKDYCNEIDTIIKCLIKIPKQFYDKLTKLLYCLYKYNRQLLYEIVINVPHNYHYLNRKLNMFIVQCNSNLDKDKQIIKLSLKNFHLKQNLKKLNKDFEDYKYDLGGLEYLKAKAHFEESNKKLNN